MKFKLFKFTTFLFVICAFLSCSSNMMDEKESSGLGENDEQPEISIQENILGKWEKIAEGMREDLITSYNYSGEYFEYLPDGTYRIWDPGHFPATGETGRFNIIGTYKIYPDSLVCSVGLADNDYRREQCYKYSFHKDTLNLFILRYSSIDYDKWAHIYDPSYDGPIEMIYLPRYFVYKRIK